MSRYFSPESPVPPAADARAELLASLERINTFNPPVQTCSTGWRCDGIYAGPTSVAYLFFRLAHVYPSMTFKGQELIDWASAYLELGLSYLPGNKRGSVDANHCGVANETLCQLALRACIDQDTSLVQEICSYSNFLLPAQDGSDEWLYGRSGYLYLLRLIKFHFHLSKYPALQELLSRTARMTIERILSTPQPWKWHGQAFLGAVHGSIGITTQIVLSLPSERNLWSAKLEPILADLLSRQRPSGNFPSSLESQSDRLVQFCHGSPGFVPCLRSISSLFPSLQPEIDIAIERVQSDLSERGLLTKDPCLCHGIPTNALASLSNHGFEQSLRYITSERLEADKSWMRKAGRSDEFVGLYTGEAGRAWTWAVLDQMERGKDRWQMGIIGFNDV